MKLSTRARYGLRICFLMAFSREVTPLSTLSKQTSLSEKYLEQLLRMLKKGAITDSKRGANGGYFLTRSPSDISVSQILDALDDNFEITDCAAGACDDKYCPNRMLFSRIAGDVNAVLKNTSLKDMVNDYYCLPKEQENKQLL